MKTVVMMTAMRVKIFGHEPALVIGAINALIMVFGTLDYALLGADQAALWVTVINAGSAALLAWATRPLSPSVFSYLFASLVALGGGYGLEFSDQFVNAVNMALVPILMLLTRGQVTPQDTAVSSTTEAAGKEEVQTVPTGNG